MTPARPSARITLDGRSFSAAEAALVRLRLTLGFAPAHDAVELVLWPSSRLASAAPGATLAVALGEVDAEQDAWSGEVSARAGGPDGVAIEGLAATVALSRSRKSQTYLRQSIADIVRDLAGSVPVAEVEGDATLESYSLDDRRSAWDHLQVLARLAGADVASAPSGGLRFVAPRTGPADIAFRFGADVLSWEVAAVPELVAPVPIAVGAGSEQGAARAHWLRRDPVPAPGAAPSRLVPAFRTRDAAEALATALVARAHRAARGGTLHVIGRADVRPGDLVAVADLPDDPGTLRVVGVEHVLDTRSGFITTLALEGAGPAAGGLPGGLGP